LVARTDLSEDRCGAPTCVFLSYMVCATRLWENYHFPLHAEIIMKHANIGKYSRMGKCNSESRDAERRCCKEHLILRRCKDQARVNVISARIDYSVQRSIWIKGRVDRGDWIARFDAEGDGMRCCRV
jgi:hypothetical protein